MFSCCLITVDDLFLTVCFVLFLTSDIKKIKAFVSLSDIEKWLKYFKLNNTKD